MFNCFVGTHVSVRGDYLSLAALDIYVSVLVTIFLWVVGGICLIYCLSKKDDEIDASKLGYLRKVCNVGVILISAGIFPLLALVVKILFFSKGGRVF